ncbi:hypothetical protein BX666DRAFT_1882544 [Dichotomocladium elegans]|nr:hypothetical protein BX666DRAFT_1882544 [Dichotomocladium elegans]
MPFKLANHGGRYLYVNDENEIQEDHDYNLSLTPKELAARGSVFDVDPHDERQLVSERGPVQYKPPSAGRSCGLEIEKVNPEEVSVTRQYVIKTATRRNNPQYVYSKLNSLGLQQEPGPMAVFTVVHQTDAQEQQHHGHDQGSQYGHHQAGQHQYQGSYYGYPQPHQHDHRRYSLEQQYEQLQAYLHGQRLQ